jgi:hypothetical protein
LWQKYGKVVHLPDLEEVEPLIVVDEDPDPEPVVVKDDDDTHQQEQAKKEQKENMDLYPNFAFMEKEMAFENRTCKGKYGDTMDAELIKWYLSGNCMSDCTDHQHFQKDIHPKAEDSSKAAPKQDTGTAMPNANPIVGPEASAASTSSSKSSSATASEGRAHNSMTSRYPHRRCQRNEGDTKAEYKEFTIRFDSEGSEDIGTLYVPSTQMRPWFDPFKDSSTIRLKDRRHDSQCVLMPIFMPTRGRAYCSTCQGSQAGRCNCGYTVRVFIAPKLYIIQECLRNIVGETL